MPTTIKLKNSVTTTNAPSSLAQGEVAINITDKKVWVGNAATTPIQLLGAGSSASFGALTCTSLTNSGLTSGRVTYASTGGLLADSANFTFNGTTVTMANDASISGLTVGKGGGAVGTNAVVGASALLQNTTGSYSVAIGQSALNANTTGYQNNALGAFSIWKNTTGNLNNGFGANSLWSNTTGSNNVAIGDSALYSNTTASNNTAVGYQAGYSNTTGTLNTFIGRTAGYSTTTSNYIVAVGGEAGYSNTTGCFTAIGVQALYANTTGFANIAIGGYDNSAGIAAALRYNTTGSHNVAIGTGALTSNTTANENTAVGYQAGYSNTTGAIDAFGAYALKTNTTALYNAAFGTNVLQANTTGERNAGLGRAALFANTTGSYNTAIGVQALQANTTANNNTAVGYQAGYSNTTGTYNTHLGYSAGYSGTTGNKNTLLGAFTGYSTTAGGQDTFNTFVGYASGYTQTSGIYNTYVGPAAGYGMTTGSKNTILGGYSGNQGGLDIRTASNYIVLSDGDGNPRVVVNSTGYLKAATNGTNIINTGGDYHELIQPDATNNALFVYCNNGSTTTNGVIRVDANRNTTNNTFYVLSYYNQAGGAYRFRVADSGNVTNTNGSYGTISDVKNKENIVDATPKLDKINQLQVRNFNFKGDDLKQIGFIAQEFEQVFPSMVEETLDKDKDGNDLGTTTKSIKTSVLVPILVKAVQELTAKVEALEAQLNK